MKTKMLQFIKLIQEHQSGLFRIAVLLVLIYCAHLLQVIADKEVDLMGIESELSDISSKLADIDSTLSFIQMESTE